MIINHNLNAMNAHRNMGMNTVNSGKSMEKLSSGLRINRAGDDAAGLGISEKMRGQIRGLDQASRNASDGISMIQTAEGALNETHSILQRMRELANQSANGTNTDTDRGSIQDEMNQLTSEINRIGNTTEFNTQKLLNGGIGSNDGAKVTDATSAKLTLGAITAGTIASGTSITVDGQTFDLSGIVTTKAAGDANLVGGATSGGVKLSDVADVKFDTAGNNLVITAKSKGATSKISVSQTASAPLGLGATTAAVTGTPTTVERAGLQSSVALSTTADITVAANSTFKINVGSESAVEVTLSGKTYNTKNTDPNIQQAAMSDLVKDLNESLQKSGLSGKVSASLGADNKVQFISETGKDLTITDGTNTPVAGQLGFTTPADMSKPVNVNQVVGPGAQGAGFNTTFQIGANKGQSMALNINDMRAAALGITGNAGQAGFTKTNGVTNGTTDVKQEAALNVMTKEDASKSIEILDKATATVSAERGKLGAMQNRLEHTINNLGTSSENLSAAESRIRDVDMAKEMLNFSKNNILSQASQAMLAQAKSQPEAVLQLLR